MGAKIDEKSIKKWSQDGKASWHRFLMDFGGFWEPSWGQVGRENRAKTSQDRPRQGKTREAKGREGKGRGREGIGRERCGKVWMGSFVARGGGVHPTLGGRPPRGSGPLVPRRAGTSYSHLVAILVPSIFPSLFRCLLGSILAPFSFPTCLQKSTKIH